jgi:small neutral amino acid transporter SnatA (MarC family)
MFAVIAPLGAAACMFRSDTATRDEVWGRQWLWILSSTAALAALSFAAALNDPLLDWLEVSPESFQLAAAAAMFPLAIRLLVAGDSMAMPAQLPGYAWLVPLGVPMLASPTSIIAAISYAARFGEMRAILASAVVLAATGALFTWLDRPERARTVLLQTLARLSGGLLILVAFELAIDGVHSV